MNPNENVHDPLVERVLVGFDLAADVGLQTALHYETDAEVACFDTDDVKSNLRMFANRKRARG